MLSGAGGWYVPGPDYLAFLDIFSPSHPFLSDSVKSWIDRAQTKWTPGNNDRWYASASTSGPASAAGQCRTAAS